MALAGSLDQMSADSNSVAASWGHVTCAWLPWEKERSACALYGWIWMTVEVGHCRKDTSECHPPVCFSVVCFPNPGVT